VEFECKLFFQHVNPSILSINIICDVADVETAKQVVKPLKGRIFRDCSIRLGPKKHGCLANFARTSSKEAVGLIDEPPSGHFRFMELPKEIRSRIFTYSDLVTPFCEVEWNRIDGYRIRYVDERICHGKYECGPPERHHACEFRDCKRDFFTGCFCMRYHASYSTRCRCWSSPTPLFLVCRGMREESAAVFFRYNRFVITPPSKASKVFDSSVLLTEVIPITALYHLRFLEVVFHSSIKRLFYSLPQFTKIGLELGVASKCY
jgi:hypothetical protein